MPSDRGQLTAGPAARVLGFIALIVAAGLLWSILDPVASTAIGVSNNTTTHAAYNTHTGHLQSIWDNTLAYVLALGGIGFLVAIIFVTR